MTVDTSCYIDVIKTTNSSFTYLKNTLDFSLDLDQHAEK